MKWKKILNGVVIAIIVLLAAFVIYMYPSYHFFFQKEIIQYDKNLIIIRGGGGNSGILITDSAIVVIDTKMGGNAEKLSKMAKEKAGQKKIIVINTHYHGDHINGNKFYKGSKIFIGNYEKSFLLKEIKPENMPTDFVNDSLALYLGQDTVMLYDLGQAHTSHDMVVYLKNRKLLFSGDLVFNKVNPVLKSNSHADVDKWITILDQLINRWDIITIVPGHGKLGGKEIAKLLREYFIDMKLAASNPDKEKEIKAKYASWTKMPFMASPDKTIKYIKEKNSKP